MPISKEQLKRCRRRANRANTNAQGTAPANSYWRKAYTNKRGTRVAGRWVKYPSR